jgi:hypothetical protein
MAQFPFTQSEAVVCSREYSYSVPLDWEEWLGVESYTSGTELPQIMLGLQVWYPMTPETLFPKPD